MVATSFHDDVLLDSEESQCERIIALFAHSDKMVGVAACARGVRVARKASCCY